MDNAAYGEAVAKAVLGAIKSSPVESVNGAAKASGIPYVTLDRRLKKDGGAFTVAELRSLAHVTGRKTADFIPREGRRTAVAP